MSQNLSHWSTRVSSWFLCSFPVTCYCCTSGYDSIKGSFPSSLGQGCKAIFGKTLTLWLQLLLWSSCRRVSECRPTVPLLKSLDLMRLEFKIFSGMASRAHMTQNFQWGGGLSQHLIIQSIHISAVKCMNFHNKGRKRPQTQFGASLAIKEFVCRVCKRTFSFLGILDFEMEGKRV